MLVVIESGNNEYTNRKQKFDKNAVIFPWYIIKYKEYEKKKRTESQLANQKEDNLQA